MTDPITKTLELSVSHTRHKQGAYSISITIKNTHVGLSSHDYPQCPGNRSTIDIFRLAPEDVLKLGNLIIEQAFRIKELQEAGNEERE